MDELRAEEPAPGRPSSGSRHRAGRAANLRAQLAVAEQARQQGLQPGVVDLPREVLEEAFELVEITVGDGQEAGGVGLRALRAGDRANLDLELVAKALHAAAHPHQLAALEAPGEHVGVAEGAPEDRAGAVAQPDRQIRSARAGDLAFLARAREHPVDLLLAAQGGDASGRPAAGSC